MALDSVDSTNGEAKRLAEAGAAANTVVWALEQSAGRGRRGRIWDSPPGNLYCSMLLRPDYPAREAMLLTFAASCSVADAVAAVLPGSAHVTCKWPNDVLVEGRKVAGILVETATEGERLEWMVLGVGVNIACHPEDTPFPATSLRDEGAGEIAPADLLESFCGRFQSSLVTWRNLGFAPIRAAWLKRAHGLGEAIQVRLEDSTLDGVFQSLDEDGSLVLRHDGKERRITAGDVFMAP